jgi:hypothetical protein
MRLKTEKKTKTPAGGIFPAGVFCAILEKIMK